MSKIKGFYSAVDKAAKELTRSKGTGKEFMVEVAKTKGVKPTEIQTRKLQSIADLPKMSKDEFIKELEKNPPPVLRETVLGELDDKAKFKEYQRIAEEEYGRSYGELDHNEQVHVEGLVDSDNARYSEYKTEGGENYREILMKLPSMSEKERDRMMALEAEHRRKPKGAQYAFEASPEGQEMKALQEKYKQDQFRSGHWDEPNVLAHMRVQDRLIPQPPEMRYVAFNKNSGFPSQDFATPEELDAYIKTLPENIQNSLVIKQTQIEKPPKKVLHVEEIQSDWHQKGRQKGYIDPNKPPFTVEQDVHGVYRVKDQNGETFAPWVDGEQTWGFATPESATNAMQNNMSRLPKTEGVPDAPFKKNWHELAMKRLLNYASENGYDKIAITPGAEQAKRYDLAKHINDLQYDPQTKTLTAWDHSGNKVVDRMNTSEDQLADYIGKEGAEKLLAQNPQDTHVKQLFGADLTFGGEGMKGFYDEMIPSYLNQFGKKYNVQVSPFDIEQPSATNPNNLTLPGYAPQPVPTMQFHGFDITPEMREEITTQGLPMFSGGGAVFDPEGEDYDYDTAKSAGLGATGEGENQGHWGSVTMASEEDKKLHGLPEDSYMLLKGRKHETWNKAEDAEKARGSEIVKRGSRYYSIPKKYADGGAVIASVGGQYDTQPDMRDGGNVIQGTAFKKGGKVTVSNNPDAMLMDVHDKKFGKGGALKKAIKGVQEILPSEQREENLRKMLESSKIKERLYHATPKSFSEFKPGGADPTVSGKAIWMSTDPERQPAAHNIHNYFGNDPYKEGVNVMPVHVQAKNPLVLDDPTMIEWAREVFAGGSKEFPELMAPNWVDQVRKEGYDSIQFADPYDLGDPHEIIMFEPNKIKSAIGNRGTYDTTDPDITKHNGGLAQIQRK